MEHTKRKQIIDAFTDPAQGRGLLWLPAGMELELDLQIGVRYSRSSHRMELLDLWYRRIDMDTHEYGIHNRRITIRNQAQRLPLDEREYDEFVNLAPWSAGSALNNELDLVMSSAGTNMTGRHHLAKHAGLVSLQDSGGFQLKTRPEDKPIEDVFIDPATLMRWMNDTADFGFVLDTPPKCVTDWGNRDVTTAMAITQRTLCDFMRENKRGDLRLLNIAHGATVDLVREWIDTVGEDGYVGWGAAHDNEHDSAAAFRTALVLIQKYNVTWVHILGVSGFSDMPVMAWLGREARITCDSTTHLTGMQLRKYFVQGVHGGLRQDMQLGNYASRDMLRLGTTLPCGCPVCRTLTYADVLSHNTMDDDGSNGSLGKLLAIHNLFAIRAYAHAWSSLALHPEMTFDTYRQLVAGAVGEKAAQLLAYVNCAMTDGLDVAEDKTPRSLFPRPTGACTKSGFEEGTNLELIRHYLMPYYPELLGELPKSVQDWWNRNK